MQTSGAMLGQGRVGGYAEGVPRNANQILLVEDDARLAGLLAEVLTQAGLSVSVENRGDRASARIIEEDPALVILDLGLPGRDGLDVCRDVRQRFGGRILVMTARGDEIDEVVGLEMGADAYLGKPVAPRRLLAHVRALLRRPAANSDESMVRTGVLSVDLRKRAVEVGGLPVALSTAEFELLWALARRLGTVVQRDDLYQELRGFAYDGIDRSVDLRVSRVRRKLSAVDPAAGELVRTVHGQGYQLVDLR